MAARLLLFILLASPFLHGAETGAADIRLAVVFRDTPSGRHHLEGVLKAVENHPFSKAIHVSRHPYHTGKNGFEVLEALFKTRGADLILGPTDSGVFAQVIEARGILEAFEVPMISSLVAADIKNAPEGWLFRTNVGVSRRTQVMYDFLNRHWIRRIGVLYADNEFGRQAEQAFREELGPAQREAYLALPYEMLFNSRHELRQILENKPEALGVFGSREEIKGIYQGLRSMNNSLAAYDPLLFTILDARQLVSHIPELYIVSLTDPEKELTIPTDTHNKSPSLVTIEGDQDALAFDTTWLSLNILQQLGDLRGAPLRKAFRDRFVALLDHDQQNWEPLTGMHFSAYENKASPSVYKLGEHWEKVDAAVPVHLKQKIAMKLSLVRRGVGFYPLLILLFFLSATYWLGFNDIAIRYPEVKSQIIKRFNFHLVVWVNFSIVSVLYLILAEMGTIRYDSFLAALMIILTSKALLHSTLFETPAGNAIGLAGYHDRLVNWLGEMIMMTAYESEKNSINIIAYHNTLRGMTDELKSIYHSARSSQRAQELIEDLNRELEEEPDILRKRKICARRLLRRLTWRKLQERHFAPQDFSANARDPERIIRAAVDFCLENDERVSRLEKLVQKKMEDAGASQYPISRHESLKDHFEEDTRDLNTEDRVQAYLGYLFLYFGYGEQQLIENGFMEDPQWILDSCVLTCDWQWKSWLKLQELWNETLADLPRKEARRAMAQLRSAPSTHQATQTQLEFLTTTLIMSRSKMIDLGLCFSRTQLFTLSYQYCRHENRSDTCLNILREMIDNPENRSRFASIPDFTAVTRPAEDASEETILRFREARRQVIKKCLSFLIYEYGYGSYPLMQRGLFPNPETLINHCMDQASNDIDLKQRIRDHFYGELRGSESITRKYYQTRIMEGGALSDRWRLQKQFFILNFKPPSNSENLDFEWTKLKVMIRLVMHKHNYHAFELSRMNLLPKSLPWLDEAGR